MAFQNIMQVTDKGYVQCIFTLEEFKNEGLFLRSGLPSTLIRHENEAVREHSSNRCLHNNPVISLIEFLWNRNPGEQKTFRAFSGWNLLIEIPPE